MANSLRNYVEDLVNKINKFKNPPLAMDGKCLEKDFLNTKKMLEENGLYVCYPYVVDFGISYFVVGRTREDCANHEKMR